MKDKNLETKQVPEVLKKWFILHFVADILFAIPLFLFPEQFLSLLGWQTIDPIFARMVAAALFGIGGESLLSRNASPDSFKTMLSLKMIWSFFAIIGFLFGIFNGLFHYAWVGWTLFSIFFLFNILWTYWYIKIKDM